MKNKINQSSLVAVVDMKTLKLYKTKGGKIINKIAHYIIDLASHKIDKHTGFYRKKNSQSSFFDPHTPEKEIQYLNSSKRIANYISDAFQRDKTLLSLYIVADTKMLGHLRKTLDDKLKLMIAKEVRKNLIHHNINDIEKAIYYD